jgi:Tfp pilus assembly ATPase PilU
MQAFDGELEKLVRAGTLDLEAAITYSTNAGNLRLLLADLAEQAANTTSKKPTRTSDPKTTLDGIEIER